MRVSDSSETSAATSSGRPALLGPLVTRRAQRYAAIQERFVAPDGELPCDVRQLRIRQRARERDDDPGPRAEGVVHHVEHPRAGDRVLLGSRREHPRRDGAPAVGRRAGIQTRHHWIVIGMKNAASATDQSPKSGSRFRDFGSTFANKPVSPPTSGRCNAKYATANVPDIVIMNCRELVTSTLQRPDTDAKKGVNVCRNGEPRCRHARRNCDLCIVTLSIPARFL